MVLLFHWSYRPLFKWGVRRDSNPHKPRPQRGAFAIMLRTQRKQRESNPQGFSGPSRFLDGVPRQWQCFQKVFRPEAHVGIEPTLRLLCRQPLTASEAMDQSGEPGNRTLPGVNPYLVSSETASQSLTLHQQQCVLPLHHDALSPESNRNLTVSSARVDLNHRSLLYQSSAFTAKLRAIERVPPLEQGPTVVADGVEPPQPRRLVYSQVGSPRAQCYHTRRTLCL